MVLLLSSAYKDSASDSNLIQSVRRCSATAGSSMLAITMTKLAHLLHLLACSKDRNWPTPAGRTVENHACGIAAYCAAPVRHAKQLCINTFGQ